MKTIEVVAAIIEHEGKVLATQRGYGEFEGSWEFPGGKVEAGETPEEAIVREIQEELSATIEVDRFVTTVDYDYDTFPLTAKWVSAETIDEPAWLPADIAVVEAIKSQGIL